MVDHSVMMFERMVSHADSASNRKFVETDFTYKVEVFGICYNIRVHIVIRKMILILTGNVIGI